MLWNSRLPATFLAALAIGIPAVASDVADSRLRDEELNAVDLENPTSIVFLGVDDVLVIEKFTGQVKRLTNWTLNSVVLDVDVANPSGMGGLGLTLDPDFANNGYVYVYYSQTDDGFDGGLWTQDVLERYTWNGSALVDPSGPLLSTALQPADKVFHHSGPIRFGPDGKLYGIVGEMGRAKFADPLIEHNTGATGVSGRGGIYRLNSDGSIPSDNPFVAETDTGLHQWFAYGVRNSFGMDWDPITGTMWHSDNGPQVWDELNRTEPGMNSGWVKILGPDARDAVYSQNGDTPYDAADLTFLSGAHYADPEFSWIDPIGVTSVCFLATKRFPEDLQNNMVVGSSADPRDLYYYALSADRQSLVLGGATLDKVADDTDERDLHIFGEGYGTTTALTIGPDGYLYQLNYNRSVINRIRPVQDLVEPFEFAVEHGKLKKGGEVELETSDDARMVLGPDNHVPVNGDVRRLRCTFQAYTEDPISLDVVIETRNNRTAIQEVELFNVANGLWEVLDRRVVKAETVVELADVSHPVEYVDPATRTIQARITSRVPNRAFGGSGERLKTSVDQTRLRIEY